MKILALGHRKRVGKDTMGRFIVTHLRTTTKNLNIQKIGFADKLKQIANELYSWAGLMDGPYYDANPIEREVVLPILNKTPREVWIELGNKLREIYADTWIEYALNRKHCDILVVTDLRYHNEFHKVQQKGGICVRVDRPDMPITHDVADDDLADMPDREWNYIVTNNSGMEHLNQEALMLANLLIRG